MYRQTFMEKKSIIVTMRNRDDKTLDGIMRLEHKKEKKIAGSFTFHIDDKGIVVKIDERNIYK